MQVALCYLSPAPSAAVPADRHSGTTALGPGRCRHLGYPPSNGIRFLC